MELGVIPTSGPSVCSQHLCLHKGPLKRGFSHNLPISGSPLEALSSPPQTRDRGVAWVLPLKRSELRPPPLPQQQECGERGNRLAGQWLPLWPRWRNLRQIPRLHSEKEETPIPSSGPRPSLPGAGDFSQTLLLSRLRPELARNSRRVWNQQAGQMCRRMQGCKRVQPKKAPACGENECSCGCVTG